MLAPHWLAITAHFQPQNGARDWWKEKKRFWEDRREYSSGLYKFALHCNIPCCIAQRCESILYPRMLRENMQISSVHKTWPAQNISRDLILNKHGSKHLLRVMFREYGPRGRILDPRGLPNKFPWQREYGPRGRILGFEYRAIFVSRIGAQVHYLQKSCDVLTDPDEYRNCPWMARPPLWYS